MILAFIEPHGCGGWEDGILAGEVGNLRLGVQGFSGYIKLFIEKASA